jgi:hypothetical protein
MHRRLTSYGTVNALEPRMQTQAYVFEQARDVIELLQTLGAQDVSLVMTDRTAEKEFSLESRVGSELPIPLSDGGERLARALHPLAALGAPGSGLVGAGSMLAYLHGAGLGSYRDLPAALSACSVGGEDVRAVVQAMRNGGVLMLGGGTPEWTPLLKSRARELTLQFPASAQPTPPSILAPATPAAAANRAATPA